MLTFRVPTDTVEYLREDRIIHSVWVLRYDENRKNVQDNVKQEAHA